MRETCAVRQIDKLAPNILVYLPGAPLMCEEKGKDSTKQPWKCHCNLCLSRFAEMPIILALGQRGRQIFESSKPTWCTEIVLEQLRLLLQ